MSQVESSVPSVIEQLFRRSSGQMAAALTRILGAEHLELAEDAVQEALLQALSLWPRKGIPEKNPKAWLIQVAKNHAINALRRNSQLARKEEDVRLWFRRAAEAETQGADSKAAFTDELKDDTLRMMFFCCHPALREESRLALTLKTLGGFDTPTIARALLVHETTVAQRIVRGKRRIREEGLRLDVPEGPELSQRLDSVLRVLYLLFNEGYSAGSGQSLVRRELVHEALRLAGLLVESPRFDLPKVHALLALIRFQGARIPARQNPLGELMTLETQDRSLWDKGWIQRAYSHFDRSIGGEEASIYHVQAAIAACHAAAASFESTDWERIRRLYDHLLQLDPSPVVALNRAVAVAMEQGWSAGLEQLAALEEEPTLSRYHLLPAAQGEFLRRLGRMQEAAGRLRQALLFPCSNPEREFLERKLNQIISEI